MLSYQHAYHAGGRADVHKHALLAAVLDYLTQKPKPLTYIETHAGRAVYDLNGPEAQKTGEAAAGIGRCEARFPAAHPYLKSLHAVRLKAGASGYPGSPAIAAALLRDADRMLLAERHPAELAGLRTALPAATVHGGDGLAWARAIVPPTPRRGVLLIDPSYEVKREYDALPDLLAALHRKWPVGVIILWYPVLAAGLERPMVKRLNALGLSAAFSEVRFAPAKPGHGMIGSGLMVVNPPWGFDAMAAEVRDIVEPD